MDGFDPATSFGPDVAATYDEDEVRGDETETVAFLDLMARLAGLRLHDRWGGWLGEPFTADSPRHISVWGR